MIKKQIPIILFLMLVIGQNIAWAETIDVDRMVNAIGKAENSIKYPYGIKSIDTHGDKVVARRICKNSVVNHIKRHMRHNCGKGFIECLGDRYCPPSVHSLNRNWVKNVTYLYKYGVKA
jgi:hypothetical protein